MTADVNDDDDLFHEPASDHPHWTETSYWGFYVPERRLSGTVYNMWRRNLGLVVSRVWVWDDTGSTPVDALYSSMHEHVAIPEGADPTSFTLPTGLSCERLAPLRSHRLRYRDGDELEFDVTTEALAPPASAFHRHAPGTGHFDQHIRVTGTLVLRGERLEVDCLSMRDRTWGVRSDLLGQQYTTVSGYMHGARSADDHWLLMAVGTPDTPGEQPIPAGTGCIVRDGRAAAVAEGVRRVTRRVDGRPQEIELDLTDELGRRLHLTGVALNHLGTMLNPSILNWWSLYRWTDEQGAVAHGESQETWIPLPAFQRAQHASPER